MKKSKIIVTTALVFSFSILNTPLFSQTQIAGHTINTDTTWTISGSPYYINGDLIIADGDNGGIKLTIEPGVDVIFNGHYKIAVLGRLIAMGTAEEKITFIPADTAVGWNGIVWSAGATGYNMWNNDSSILEYCVLNYSKSNHEGGAVSIIDFSLVRISYCEFSHNSSISYGGSIYLASSPIIEHCTITYSTAEYGGALLALNSSKPIISYCLMQWNHSQIDGGALCLWSTEAKIQNNRILNNFAGSEGGAIFMYSANDFFGNNIIANNKSTGRGTIRFNISNPVFINNTIANNESLDGCLSFWGFSAAGFYNNIIWGNKDLENNDIQISKSETCIPIFSHCVISGDSPGFTGSSWELIMDDDPEFISPSTSGYANDALSADWGLQWSSGAINMGNLNTGVNNLQAADAYGKPRIMNGAIDIGASEAHIISIPAGKIIDTLTYWTADTLNVRDTVIVSKKNASSIGKIIIAPGTIVLFHGAYPIDIQYGSVIAKGNTDNPITFTMDKADTSGFNSMSDPTGGWKGFIFDNDYGGSNGAMNTCDSSIFDHCIFEYGKNITSAKPDKWHVGGIFNVVYFSKITITNSVFRNNIGYVGGCIKLSSYSNISIKNNLFTKNKAIQSGGAINTELYCNPAIFNNLFSNNAVVSLNPIDWPGGGAVNLGKGTPVLVNNIFCNNYSSGDGGAVYLRTPEALLVNNTIVNNSCKSLGGGLYAYFSSAKLYNSIIWGNTAESNTGQQILMNNSKLTIHNCAISKFNSNPWSYFYPDVAWDWNGVDATGIISLDPSFVKPGTIQDDGLLADFNITDLSGAINNGTTNIPGFMFPAYDYYGNPRINGGKIDLGASENQGHLPEISSHPVGGSFCEESGHLLEVGVSGTDTVRFQWRKDGEMLEGDTTSNLNLQNLTLEDAGSYTSIVSNAYGNVESSPANLSIKTLPQILSTTDNQQLCENKDFSLEVSATGYMPLTYEWQKDGTTITGETASRYKHLNVQPVNGGNYRVKVSNPCGKDSSENITVTIFPSPKVNLGPNKILCANSGFLLDPGVFQSYLWNDFTSNRYKKVETTGDYFVVVTGNKGCMGTSDTVSMQVKLPYPGQKLCMVTVDPETKKNMVIWEKVYNQEISSYNVYKLFGNNFVPIGNVLFDEIPQFIDYSSSPEAIAARYSVSVVDNCGNESDKSLYHQTMQLGASEGIQPNTVVLDWTNYIDESKIWQPAWYYIYRGTDPAKLALIDSVSSVFSEWNDLDPANNRYYQVSCKKSVPCDPAELIGKKASSGPYLHSLSNLEDNRLQSTGINDPRSLNSLKIYPNPLKTESILSWKNPGGDTYDLLIYDLKGTLVRCIPGLKTEKYILSRENLENGCYIIELRGEKTVHVKLLVN